VKDADGKEMALHTIRSDGTKCGTCARVIRVREQACWYTPDGPWVCRDCLYTQPLTEHNTWRRDRKEPA
jgi:hypothetical protein